MCLPLLGLVVGVEVPDVNWTGTMRGGHVGEKRLDLWEMFMKLHPTMTTMTTMTGKEGPDRTPQTPSGLAAVEVDR